MEAVSVSTVLLTVLCLPLAVLVTLWGWYQWSHRRVLALARKLPTGLPTVPVIGHLYLASSSWEQNSRQFMKLMSLPMNCTYCFWIGPVPYITIQRPDDLRTVLNSSKALGKSPDYNHFKFFFGDGLVTASAHMWKKSRRGLNPVFQPRNVQHLEPAFNERANQLITELSQLVGRGQVDITHQLTLLIINNSYGLMFGPDKGIEPNSKTHKIFTEFIERVTYTFINRIIYLWYRWEPFFLFMFKDTIRIIDQIWSDSMGKLLNEQLQEIEKCEQEDSSTENNLLISKVNSGEYATLSDAFSVLLKTDPEMFGESYMRGEAQTILAAGTDTVKGILSVCLVCLAGHPHIQERMYQEIEEVVGTSTKYISGEDVNKMTYLDQVIKETMRKFNVVPFAARVLTEDIALSDCVLPAGCTVVINPTGLHLNPRHYPKPDQFDPDRFSPENVAAREKFSFIPFVGGIRDCIGRHYAMTMMKITLAHLVREFFLTTTLDINNLQYRYGVSLVFTDGCKVSLQKRKSQTV